MSNNKSLPKLSLSVYLVWFVVLVYWTFHRVSPFMDDACYFYGAVTLGKNLNQNGLVAYVWTMIGGLRPLLPTLAGGSLLAFKDLPFQFIAGVLNLLWLAILTKNLSSMFRHFLPLRSTYLATIYALSLPWVFYLYTVFECQLPMLAFLAMFLNYYFKSFDEYLSFSDSFRMSTGAVFAIISRPFDVAPILLSLVLIWFLTLYLRHKNSKTFLINLSLGAIIPFSILLFWLYYSYPGLIKWLEISNPAEWRGTFFFKGPDLTNFISAIFKEFFAATAFIIFVSILATIFSKIRGSKYKFYRELDKKILDVVVVLFCSIFIVLLIWIFAGPRNPIYFMASFFTIIFCCITISIKMLPKFSTFLIVSSILFHSLIILIGVFDVADIHNKLNSVTDHLWILPRAVGKQIKNENCFPAQ